VVRAPPIRASRQAFFMSMWSIMSSSPGEKCDSETSLTGCVAEVKATDFFVSSALLSPSPFSSCATTAAAAWAEKTLMLRVPVRGRPERRAGSRRSGGRAPAKS
jgi:hypothetical protein